jgi:hypothetical protein
MHMCGEGGHDACPWLKYMCREGRTMIVLTCSGCVLVLGFNSRHNVNISLFAPLYDISLFAPLYDISLFAPLYDISLFAPLYDISLFASLYDISLFAPLYDISLFAPLYASAPNSTPPSTSAGMMDLSFLYNSKLSLVTAQTSFNTISALAPHAVMRDGQCHHAIIRSLTTHLASNWQLCRQDRGSSYSEGETPQCACAHDHT